MIDNASREALAPEARPAARELGDWLLARGRHWVTVRQAAAILGIPEDHVAPTLSRWRHRGLFFSPTKGLYVVIPPEYRQWGAIPGAHFIDPFMRRLGHRYYVALLSAAEIHGAAHQRPQVFQVMTSGRLRDRSFGRVRLEFIASPSVDLRATERVNTPTGTAVVSTPAVTVLDLVAFPHRSGGLSNVATVLGELLEDHRLEPERIAEAAAGYPVAVVQRTGFILDHVAAEIGVEIDLSLLVPLVEKRSTPTPLLTSGPRSGARDRRWNVVRNVELEGDL